MKIELKVTEKRNNKEKNVIFVIWLREKYEEVMKKKLR